MAQASSQHKLDRVRPPRVHITYDVEIGDAIEIRELPFQLGILGDFTGTPAQPLPRLRDRKFVEVNPDNFDEVLEGMAPHLALTVENRLAGTDGAPALRVDLHFKSLEDFEPENVARQVNPLRELLDLRRKLNDLLGKLQGNDRLEELLTDAVSDPGKLKKLESEIHGSDASPTPPPVATESITVEPQAPGDIPVEEAVDVPGVIEAEAKTESASEEVPAPPTEAEQIDFAPEVNTPLEAATGPDTDKVEEKKESEDPAPTA